MGNQAISLLSLWFGQNTKELFSHLLLLGTFLWLQESIFLSVRIDSGAVLTTTTWSNRTTSQDHSGLGLRQGVDPTTCGKTIAKVFPVTLTVLSLLFPPLHPARSHFLRFQVSKLYFTASPVESTTLWSQLPQGWLSSWISATYIQVPGEGEGGSSLNTGRPSFWSAGSQHHL